MVHQLIHCFFLKCSGSEYRPSCFILEENKDISFNNSTNSSIIGILISLTICIFEITLKLESIYMSEGMKYKRCFKNNVTCGVFRGNVHNELKILSNR